MQDQAILSNDDLFSKDYGADDVKHFYENYGEEPFMSSVLSTLRHASKP